MNIKKLISVLLVGSIIFCTSCTTEEKIENNEEPEIWFDSSRNYYEVLKSEDENIREYISETPFYCDDKYIYTLGKRDIEDRTNETDECIATISRFSVDGEYQDVINLTETLNLEGTTVVNNVFSIGGQFYALRRESGLTQSISIAPIDLDSMSVGEIIKLQELTKYCNKYSARIEDIFTMGETLVIGLSCYYDDGQITRILLMDQDFNVTELNISNAISNITAIGYSFVRRIDEENILIGLNTADNGGSVLAYVAVNINSGEHFVIEDKTVLDKFFCSKSADYFMYSDRLYVSDEYGIYKYNLETNDVDIILDFNNCNVNRQDLRFMVPISVSENEIILFGDIIDNPSCDLLFGSIYLKKSDINKKENKDILLIGNSNRNLMYEVAEAIYQFNESSPDSFIELSDEYLDNKFFVINDSEINASKEREDTRIQIEGEASRANILYSKLINGEGPDIILNFYDYTCLNNDNCLLDIRSYLDKEGGINTADYFGSIFDKNKAIYQIPLSFYLSGVVIKGNPHESTSLTFDEFHKLVDSSGDGYNPFYEKSRKEILFGLLESSNYSFVKDNKIDVNNQEFRLAIDYAKKFSESSYDDYKYSIETPENAKIKLGQIYIQSYHYYSHKLENDSYLKVYGMPAAEGYSVPKIVPEYSVAISANCKNKDAAIRFVSLLLSEEFQNYVFLTSPVNRKSFDKLSDSFNKDGFVDAIEQGELMEYIDPEIKKIIWEEAQAYFAGDKNIDETISIIENRAQKLLDERL